MTTTGARAARETGMQTQQVEWAEAKTASSRQVHEVAEVAGVQLATIRTYANDNGVTYFWCATARAPGTSLDLTDCGHGASLDEVRAAAVGRATWLAAALRRVMTPVCADCGEAMALDDLTDDGRCERCATACLCATCGDTFPLDEITGVDGDEMCAACVEAREDDDGDQCGLCAGTGIGQHGDPDTSSCHACSDGGVRRPGSDPDEAYDRWRDRDF